MFVRVNHSTRRTKRLWKHRWSGKAIMLPLVILALAADKNVSNLSILYP